MVFNKLGELEDIMEKYGIEDLEQYLQVVREVDKELRYTIQRLHTIIDTIGYDRDTWKRACELAVGYICLPQYRNINLSNKFETVKSVENYFYQQAKKEKGKDRSA